jgi:hypothetical protein
MRGAGNAFSTGTYEDFVRKDHAGLMGLPLKPLTRSA